MTVDGEQLAGVTVVLGVCIPERRRVAEALLADLRLATDAETEIGLLEVIHQSLNHPTQPERVVVQCGSGVLPHDVVALFDSGPLSDRAVLAAVITVVDAEHVLADLAGGRSVHRFWTGRDERQPLAAVAVEQIEYADAIVVANWRRMRRASIGQTLALLAHLNPAAQLSMFRSGYGWAARMAEVRRRRGQTAGWVRILNDAFAPHMTGFELGAFRYEQLRPFHPERLLLLLESGFEQLYGRLLRSAGLCRIATRPGVTGRWDQVGAVIALQPLAQDRGDDPLSVGQDIAFIGLNLDRAAMTAALDACTLTDDELAAGPTVWRQFTDPLPSWQGSLPDPGW